MANKLNSINKNVDASQRSYQVFTPNLDKFSDKYKGLAESNPYANPTYKRSWWQSLLSNLGFRTNYDAYLEGMNLQAQEYENALLQKQYDEEYNSPMEQANRERLAGLNPNLTGNVSSGEASPLADDGNPPIPPQADDFQNVITFATSVVSGLQSAFSLASGVVGLSGAILDNRGRRLDQISKEDNLMFDALLNVLPSDKDAKLDYNQLYASFKKTYGSRIKKRYFPDFVNRALAFQNGLTFDDRMYSKRDSRVSGRKGFYIKSSGSDYSEENEVMSEISGVLADLAISTQVSTQESQMASNEASKVKSANDLEFEKNVRPELMANELEYNQALDPSKIAENEMSTSDLELGLLRNEKDNSDYQRQLRSAYKSIFNKLDKLEDNGNWFAPYAKLAISAYLLGNLPGINVSKTKKGWSFSTK